MALTAPINARAKLRENALCATVRGVDIWQDAANPLLAFWAEKTEEIEPELLDWIDSFEAGAVFYDLGASIGAFSIYAAKKGLQVFAFEAEAQNYAVAEKNHFLNGDEIETGLSIFNVAVSDSCRMERLYIRRYNAGEHNKIVGVPEMRDTHQAFAPDHVQPVLAYPLDVLIAQFGLPVPRYIKIDIDGSEEPALRGSPELFSSPELREVFIEVSKPDEAGEGRGIMDLMAGYGFEVVRKDPVLHMKGGVYPDLFNIVFRRVQA